MNANDIQHGGDHYKGSDYQHWDWVSDCRLHYLAGAASKYAMRWRKKNGLEDLNKAIHYIDKAEEVGVTGSSVTTRYNRFWQFAISNHLVMLDATICFYIMEGDWELARFGLKQLLANLTPDQQPS